MSLLPFLLNDLNSLRLEPSPNQRHSCRMTPEDLLTAICLSPGNFDRIPTGSYLRPWRSSLQEADTGSTITIDKNKYQVNLDVQQFEPEEITVKVAGKNIITVEGKHEEKEDDYGCVSRHFVRKYVVPDGHNLDEVVSTLSSDGVLTITAPKTEKEDVDEREISVTRTGVPSKNVNKTTEDKQL